MMAQFSLILIALFIHISVQAKQVDYSLVLDRSVVEIDKMGRVKFHSNPTFEAHSEAGRTALSMREITYLENTSSVKVISARSIYKNKVTPVDLKKIQIRNTSGSTKGIENLKKVIIPFDNVKVNSRVSYAAEIKTLKPLIPGVGTTGFIYGYDFPESNSDVSVISEKPIKYMVLDFFGFLDVTTRKSGGKYILRIKTTRKVDYDNFTHSMGLVVTPSDYVPTVYVSTAENWNQIVSVMAPKYNKAIESPLPKEFSDIVKRAKSKKSPVEQLNVVLREVKKYVGYSGNWVDRTAMVFPKGHNVVLKEGKGDCKDFATTITALARKLGFKANVALVNASNPVNRGLREVSLQKLIPTLEYFNHAVAYVELPDKRKLWLDGTTGAPVSDVISATIERSPALILTNGNRQLTRVDLSGATPEKMVVTRESKALNKNHANWTGSLELVGLGPSQLDAIQSKVNRDQFSQIMATLPLEHFAVKESRLGLKSTPFKNLSSHAKLPFSIIGSNPLTTNDRGEKEIFLGLPQASQKLIPPKRTSGAYVGHPMEKIQVTRFKNVAVGEYLPSFCQVYSKWADFERTIAIEGKDTVVREKLVTKTSYLHPEVTASKNYMEFRDGMIDCYKGSTLKLASPNLAKFKGSRLKLREIPVSPSSKEAIIKFARFGNNHPADFTYLAHKVIAIMDLVLKRNPNDQVAQAYRLDSILDTGYQSGDDYDAGIIEYVLKGISGVISKNQNIRRAFMTRAKIYESTKQYKKMLRDLFSAYKLDKENLATMGRIAVAYAYIGNKNLALKWLESSKGWILKDNQWAWYYGYLTDVGYILDDSQMKLEGREKLVELKPNNPWVIHNLSFSYLDLKRWDDAIKTSKKALSIMEFGAAKYALSLGYFGKAQERMNDRKVNEYANDQKIEDLLKMAIEQNAKNHKAFYHLAKIHVARVELLNDPTQFDIADYYIEEGLKHMSGSKLLRNFSNSLNSKKLQVLARYKSQNKVPPGRWPATLVGRTNHRVVKTIIKRRTVVVEDGN